MTDMCKTLTFNNHLKSALHQVECGTYLLLTLQLTLMFQCVNAKCKDIYFFFCCQNLCENETRCLWSCTFSQTPLSPLTVTQVGALNKTGKLSEGPLLPPPFPKHPDTNN